MQQPTPPPERPERREQRRGRLHIFADGLYRFLRFIGRHVRGFYAALITYVSFSIVVGLIAATVFALVAEEVLEGDTQAFDEAVLVWVDTHRTDFLNEVALEITALGNAATLIVLALSVCVFLWLTHHRYSVYLLLIALAGGSVLNWLLKDVFGRPRPTVVEWGTEVVSASFPSGHAMSAAIVYGAVAYLGGRLEPTPKLRWTTWTLAALLILAIGASRIYLGVHYPSDVIAGFIAGLAWTAFVVSGLSAVRYFAGRKPEVRREEKDLEGQPEAAKGS